jgi:hypothetical protein
MNKKIKKKLAGTGKHPCDKCRERHFLSEHHIRGRDIPNPNHPSNLCYICDNCHREVHEGLVVLEGWFLTDRGYELLWHRQGEEGISGDDAQPHRIVRKDSPPSLRKD